MRLGEDLLARLDKQAERLSKANPGLTVTRVDVVRMPLTQGLDVAESQAKGRR